MTWLHAFGFATLSLSLLLSGCKSDPPPPPALPTSATAGADSTAKAGVRVKHGLDTARRSGKVPRLQPATMKRYRAQACYFGSQGLKVARDAYLGSLAGSEPSAKKLPSFGEYPEHAKLKERFESKGRKAVFWGRGLPFVRHLRSCAIAKTLDKGKDAAVDAALGRFDSYAGPLNKTLMEAHRYYARNEHEKDEFRQGRSFHAQLTKAFADLDAQLESFSAAIAPWLRGLGPVPEKQDEGAKVASKAVMEARVLTLDALASTADAAGVKAALDALGLTRDALQARQISAKREPHPRVVMPRLKQFVEAATKLSEALATGTKLSASALYPTTSAMAALVEANHRAHSHLLRRAAGAGPMRMLKPPMHHIGTASTTAPVRAGASAAAVPSSAK